MDDPEGREELSRRELLRRGLVAGGSIAALGVTLSGGAAGTAAAAPGSTGAGVSLALAAQWPGGAAVDPSMPWYLSPDPGEPGGGGGTSSAVAVLPGDRTGIRAPLLVVPLVVSVDLVRPVVLHPPFNVLIVATGDGLMEGTEAVQLSVPFLTKDAGGRIQAKPWLAILPVTLGPGSIDMQATIQTGPNAPLLASPILTVTGDFSGAPLATTLAARDQVSLVEEIATQSEVSVDTAALFRLLETITGLTKERLLAIKAKQSAISIGDMFEMQMNMKQMGQLVEMSVSVTSAINDAISSMCRNCRG